MRALILGCDRLTIGLATGLASAGNQVTVLSQDRDCLERLAEEPGIIPILTTEPSMQDYLQEGGVATADVFLALSDDDHQNALMAQIAHHIFNVPKVICHLSNPQLQTFYKDLGLDVVGYSMGLAQEIRRSIES
jgi:trk system potassium uptake protein TrkA